MLSHVIMTRAVFRIDGDIFVSAGALYYVSDKTGQTHFLMQQRNDKNYLEDIGGKSDPDDTSIESIVKRETLEELNCFAPVHLRPNNNIITPEFLEQELKQCEQILIPESKYVLFFVQLPIDQRFDLTQYSDTEYDESGGIAVKRTLCWVTKSEYMKSPLHPRIQGLENFLP